MFKKTQIIFSTIFVLLAFSSFGQKQLKKADIQLENGDYDQAIETLKDYLADQPTDVISLSKLANAYLAIDDLSSALGIYEAMPSNISEDPIIHRNFGNILKRLGRYADAIAEFEKYSMYNPIEGQKCIKSCEYAKQKLSTDPTYDTYVLPSNSSASDFGLTFYKDLPVFSSFRNDILMSESEVAFNNNSGDAHKTFIYNQKKNRLGFIKALDGNLNNIGPISFTKNGLVCAIIESKFVENQNFIANKKLSSLHIATVNDKGEITSSKPFVYNEVGASINAASMAFDGSAIYFSSNRKGGYGGYDIYVSYLNLGEWSLPKNLGPNINTPGNEVTPFLQGNELYFASDYHEGLGGLDILKSISENGLWSNPENMGAGVNSISDDYFPTFNNNGELFITSNRLGGKGKSDIYKTQQLKQDTYAAIPASVSLDDLATQTQLGTSEVRESTAVSLVETLPFKADEKEDNIAFTLPNFDTNKVGSNTNKEIAWEGAKRIALDELIPNTEVFFIQLASISSVKPNFNKFRSLIRYGNIYKMNGDRSIKVRLGYFTDRSEAEEILKRVRANGYADAFITFEILNTAQMELILSSNDEKSFTDEGNLNSKNPSDEIKNFKVGSKYKVRLASYEDPIWFDINKVKDLGRIEQWTKGGWTIFILAGYNNIDEAKSALIQANNRGFKTAEVVIDNGGILERLKSN